MNHERRNARVTYEVCRNVLTHCIETAVKVRLSRYVEPTIVYCKVGLYSSSRSRMGFFVVSVSRATMSVCLSVCLSTVCRSSQTCTLPRVACHAVVLTADSLSCSAGCSARPVARPVVVLAPVTGSRPRWPISDRPDHGRGRGRGHGPTWVRVS